MSDDADNAVKESGGEEEDEEEDGPKYITPNDIRDSCIKNHLYTIPELNETLYLHYGGFQKISSLEPYVNLTSLWLNNNSINVIEGISHLKNLVCLYLNGNVIEKIQGLDELENLETLCLSNNYISRVENLSNLKKLHTLELDHNNIKTADCIMGVLEVPSLGNLNLSFNKLETEEFLPIVSQLKNLVLLKMTGNPIARTMSQYRRKILYQMPTLTYLDEMPVNELEIRCSRAYMEGGREAEMEERQRYRQEKEDEKTENRKKLRRANRKAAIEAGLDISKDKYLMSSDDERLFMSSDDDVAEFPKKKEEDISGGKVQIQLEEESSSSEEDEMDPEKAKEHGDYGRKNKSNQEDDID